MTAAAHRPGTALKPTGLALQQTVIIENVEPTVDAGRYPVKREVGDLLTVSADIFKEGHDVLVAYLRYRAPRETQWREVPSEFGAWATVSNRFRQWRDAGVFEALLEGMIAEAAKRGEVDLSLVGVDSTTARAHHDAAGTHLGQEVMAALEKAAAEEEKARQKGAARKDGTDRML